MIVFPCAKVTTDSKVLLVSTTLVSTTSGFLLRASANSSSNSWIRFLASLNSSRSGPDLSSTTGAAGA